MISYVKKKRPFVIVYPNEVQKGTCNKVIVQQLNVKVGICIILDQVQNNDVSAAKA